MYTVLLSGGSGKRLWPLSNEKRSKQYVRLTQSAKTQDNCSMVQRVWEQLCMCGLQEHTVITAEESQSDILKNQLGTGIRIIAEPMRRNTFPAIALSCAYLVSEMHVDPEDVVTILSVDTFAETHYFQTIQKLAHALPLSQSAIGLIGTIPTYASEKYGYLRCSKSSHQELIQVNGFIEKPDIATAESLIQDGALWNCGVFCFQIKDILPYLACYGLSLSYPLVFSRFNELPAISFDYEVTEKASVLVALCYDGFWKDIGTWNTLTEQMTVQTVGDVCLDDTCTNTHVINELDMPVIVMGMKNAVVAASFDGILVTGKHESSYIKKHVEPLHKPAMYEERSWGYIKVLDSTMNGDMRINTSKVVIFTGMRTDYAKDSFIQRTIIVIRGTGEWLTGVERHPICMGETLSLQTGDEHVIYAVDELEFIEIKINAG